MLSILENNYIVFLFFQISKYIAINWPKQVFYSYCSGKFCCFSICS